MKPYRRAAIYLIWVFAAGASTVRAQRVLDKADYADKLRGMWFGQLIGNHAGRPTEGLYTLREPAPDEVFAWDLHTSCADPWTGDDDTNVEFLYLHALESLGISPSSAQFQSEWVQHTGPGFFFANRQAQFLMGHGFVAPQTGSWRNNVFSYTIDCQITTESIGAYAPGMRQWAIDVAGLTARVTNDGFPVHAAQFYAAMYATAAFESDIETIVDMAHTCIPATSRSWRVIQDVRAWHAADLSDGVPDWWETRRMLFDAYRYPANGRYRGWVESTVNLGCTTLALLYGDGNFEETVKIGVLAGFDSDCNPATAGGLVGLIHGYSNLPTSLTATATDCYRVDNLNGLTTNTSIITIADRMNQVAENVIISLGGSANATTLTVPDESAILIEPALPDPTGPTGLVELVQSGGGTVEVDASVYTDNPMSDRDHIGGIIDGVINTRHNGHLAYDTHDPQSPQPGRLDFYELRFSKTLRFDAVTFYEGDILQSSASTDPRLNEPLGGYFLNLTVDVHGASGWREAANVQLSEPLDPFAFFQVIQISFDPIAGDALRIRGESGGQHGFTSILELACAGGLVGDFDESGACGPEDIPPFVATLLDGGQSGVVNPTADMNADDAVNGDDITDFVGALLAS